MPRKRRVAISQNVSSGSELIGASAAQVRRAYPTGLLAEEHSYTGAPAEYLTFWVRRERSGVRFTTDENRRVDTIIAGNESIRYIKGCA